MSIVEAIIDEDIGVVWDYLKEGGDVAYCEDNAGVTLLHHAIYQENVSIIFLLLAFGADWYRQERIFGCLAIDMLMNNQSLLFTLNFFLNYVLSKARIKGG